MTTCTLLPKEHGEAFGQKVAEIRGRKRPYFSTDPAELFKPEQIPNSDLWVETNFSARDIERISRLMLVKLGYEDGELGIEVGTAD